MKSKRKSAIVVAALALVALMLVSLTLAYLTDRKSLLNVIGLGSNVGPGPGPGNPAVAISLDEPEFAKIATKTADGYQYDNLKPGKGIDKDPTVTSVGNDEVYVRVRLVITDGNGAQTNLTADEIKNNALFQDFGFAVDESNWKNVGDEWYLVDAQGNSRVLANGEFAEVLKANAEGNTISVPASYTNKNFEDLGKLLKIEVVAEAIQAEGFAPNLNDAKPWGNEAIIPAA